jgi:3-deoxy-D-manno-octulosonic-acid transferase
MALYQLVLFLAWPLVRVRLWWRGRHEPGYRERVAERFGQVPADVQQGALWVHAVSAGETIAAVPMIERLLQANPDVPLLVTTMTPTGSGEVIRRLGNTVSHCYAPYDFPWAVDAFLDTVRPRALILMETELWPNLVLRSRRRGIPVVLVNGRLSERSARGYARIGALVEKMLKAFDLVACQSEAHRSRFLALGARPDSVRVLGSVKFDLRLNDEQRAEAARLRLVWGLADRPVLIAASTHPGEEERVLEAFETIRRTVPSACLLLVPRHPVRATEVVELVVRRRFSVMRQSEPERRAEDVVVGDVMGSLLTLYGVADVAFVGGSLVAHGGHNPIEAAVWGKPVLVGPRVFNFQAVVDGFREAGALTQVTDAAMLAAAACRLMRDSEACAAQGAAGAKVVAASAGALDRTLAALAETLLLRTE